MNRATRGLPSRALAAALAAALSLKAFAEPAVAPDALPSGFRKRSSENPVRRFEIIAMGAFPIALFYTGFAFDLEKYAANGFDSQYAPWPFKGDYSADPTASEYALRLSVAGGLSLAVAGADALIQFLRYRDEGPPPPAAPAPPEGQPPAAGTATEGPELDSARGAD